MLSLYVIKESSALNPVQGHSIRLEYTDGYQRDYQFGYALIKILCKIYESPLLHLSKLRLIDTLRFKIQILILVNN